MKGKNGQIEILGLAVLVIVLAIILIIALSFNLDSNEGSDIRTGLIANNLLNALIKQEGKINFKNFVFECYNNIKKGQTMESSCDSLNKEISKTVPLIINNKEFEISFESNNEEFYKLGRCINRIESTKYRFKSNGESFTASIRLC